MAVMANQAWMVFDFFFCSSPGILRQPLHFAREREKHFGTFSVYVRLMVLKLASLKKKKENDDFQFFQNSFTQLLYS